MRGAANDTLTIPPSFGVDFDARLVEEAVLLALAGQTREAAFHAQRDPMYERLDPEGREKAFRALHTEWFVGLGLDRPVRAALLEQPLVLREARGCRVIVALGKQDEGADLYRERGRAGMGALPPLVVLRLRPTSLIAAASLRTLLRRELLYLADMLEASFGYSPELPRTQAGPVFDALLVSRYRAVWDASVDGRLLQCGWAGIETRQRSRACFAAAFPMLREETESCFAAWFEGREPPRHLDFLDFARNPGGRAQSSRCPLCQFPTPQLLEPQVSALAPETVAEIERRHPHWQPEAGICRQCADLYAACSRA